MKFLFLGAVLAAGAVYSQKQNIEDAAAVADTDTFTRYDALFKKYGKAHNVPWRWLKAFCLNESTLGTHPAVVRGLANASDPDSVSEDGKSYGLMQLTLGTAGDYLENVTFADLNDPNISVDVAAQFIRHLMDKFGGIAEEVVKAYNEGEGNEAKELKGTGGGFADEYWARWQRNLQRVMDQQPGDELETG